MCNFSGQLVAWMDGELAGYEATDVERHVSSCAECRGRLAAYEAMSSAIVNYCDAAAGLRKRRAIPYWVPVVSGAAAVATLLLVALMPPSVKQIPIRPRVAEVPPIMVLQSTPPALKKLHGRPVVASEKTPAANWALAAPAVQVTIPAEAMFPPGAVPEGVNFVAELSIAADGSVQGLRLQP